MKRITTIMLAILTSVMMLEARNTEVTIVGEEFHINGRPTYEGRYWKGHKIEGLLMNSRMVQGVFDDITKSEEAAARFAYPDTGKWDADRNTAEFVDAMEEWYSHGMLAFTINLQGGSPSGYGGNVGFVNSAFDEDGKFRDDYKSRLKLILDRANKLGMVVILGYFYPGQDQHLADEAAVYRAVTEATEWVLKSGYRNVMIEVANECDVKYDQEIIRAANITKLITYIQGIERKGRRLLVSTSFKGRSIPTEEVVAVSDFILLHGNSMRSSDLMPKAISDTRALKSYTPKPVMVNEDDNYNFSADDSNLALSIERYVSWGYFDFRRKGEESIDEGYQSIPVNWGISSDRKRAFFDKVKEITGF